MKFGPVPLAKAEGAVLAHSLVLESGPIRKGRVLEAGDIERLKAEGLAEVVVARVESGDMAEDDAAALIGAKLEAPGVSLGPVFTGRVNLIAAEAGVVRISAAAISAVNGVNEGLTVATLPDLMRVARDQLVATVKIIPYGIEASAVQKGATALGTGAIALSPFQGGKAKLVMTKTPGFKPSLLTKGEAAVRDRVEALGYTLEDVVTVPHEVGAVTKALAGEADLVLVLGASATSDRNDVAPAAVVAAGGEISRFGMPVDPGNLLFLGALNGAPVVGLPGCARSLALNGVDWVLERLSARVPITGEDIAAMGVGGLLKEMPGRPQPRRLAK